MSFVISASSDAGLVKTVNQDSFTIKLADTYIGEVVFAVICDGMGGFSSGEIASSSLINMFSKWFKNDFSQYDLIELDPDEIFNEWKRMLIKANHIIQKYGNQNSIKLGTTITALLMFGNKYYCVNVGDSRAYYLRNGRLHQITKDQTLVQREIDAGNISAEDAEIHPQRNVLLHCIGCDNNLKTDFYFGEYTLNDIFLLCSDGFRHKISSAEIAEIFTRGDFDEDSLTKKISYLIELNKSRKETDNITALIVSVQ